MTSEKDINFNNDSAESSTIKSSNVETNDSETNKLNQAENHSVEKLSGMTLLSDGFRFHFKVDDHEIEAWGSGKSGKESVTFDGVVVSEKRSLRRKSIHSFEHQGVLFEIEFNMVNMLTSELHCSLIKDGVHVETRKVMPKATSSKSEFLKGFLTWFAIGGVCGFVGMFLFLQFLDK